jgi:endonuclease/exonuclease/phosphatase family metal-dependent hydrolase
VNLSILSDSINHILCSISDGDRRDDWFLSCIYGHPEENNKWKTWDLIKQIHNQVGHKWLCMGDLNDMLQADDKKGGLSRSQSQLGVGRQTVEACGLNDMGIEGYPFTWTNGRHGSENIQCRLDRALGTEDFLNRFSPWKVSHLQRYGSDHAAILIQLEHHDCRKKKEGPSI